MSGANLMAVPAEPLDETAPLRQAEMLLDLTRRLVSRDSLLEMIDDLVQTVSREITADRCTFFMNDPETRELFSYVAQGSVKWEIRILNSNGVAGWVYTHAQTVIIPDPYADSRFDPSVDRKTGYTTRNILCAPVRTEKGEMIGVIQALNKLSGEFTEADLRKVLAISSQAAHTLQSAKLLQDFRRAQEKEREFVDVVTAMTSEIDLTTLLQKVMKEITRLLKADRATLFLNDEKTGELWSQIGSGLDAVQIRFPNHLGIAGAAFTSNQTINIPHAYADLRFNPSFDRKTGYFTRSILCVPLAAKDGRVIGVTQVLNKWGGAFTEEDEARLRAFTSQVSVALENAKLFNDVQVMKNYNEGVLESMTNGVVTLSEDEKIAKCNAAAFRILKCRPADVLGKPAREFFAGPNEWVLEKLKKVGETQKIENLMDAVLRFRDETIAANLTLLPLLSAEKKKIGSMIMVEDITSEKRMKSTMSRYVDPSIADQLLEGGQELLGGKVVEATLLFSDIRGFTTITETLGPQGTVKLLNEYFTIMVDCLQREGGMLDKFIGDAMMCAFGMPIKRDDDEDRAVRSAISMIRELDQWNAERKKSGQPPVHMGIGLNTDKVVTGNIGSPKRMDYTSIGDGVNLASRLESACKQFHARILISEFTRKRLKGTYRMREIDRLVVKGKTEPVAVFEVLDYHTDESFPHLMEALKYFDYGRTKYLERKWDMAIEAFREVLRQNPGDELSQDYVERCERLKESPPPPEWTGVYVMKEK